MQIIENELINEKVYIEKLESGFTIYCIPKKNTKKKYAICGVGYGSNYNHFIIKDDNKEVTIPDGVAHYLEHKMFEQESGENSLDVLSSLGVNANAYTTNDHTAYLFECTKNFEKALDELLEYLQNPYFTDENVEKERGIISQEIKMYDDDPDWRVYINCMKALYINNPIRIDVAGSVESINQISKDILYECYNNFYVPENMVLIIIGDFEPEDIIQKVKEKVIIKNKLKAQIINQPEPLEISTKKLVEKMDITIPFFTIGYKVNPIEKEKIKRTITIEILLEIIFGLSSDTYNELYEKGLIYENLITSFEWSNEEYAHILIQGKTFNFNKVIEIIHKKIDDIKNTGISEKTFETAKRKIYGLYIREFNDISNEATLFAVNYFKRINPFDYIEEFKNITKEYSMNVLREVFEESKEVVSMIMPK